MYMLNNIIKILLIILFFSLPIIHSRIFDFFWFKSNFLFVNWNFEFTKVMYFNVFTWIIILFFILTNIIKKNKNIIIPKFILFIFISLILSSLFAISPYNSIFSNLNKSHDFIMFVNLIWIYIVLLNTNKIFLKKIFYISIISWIIISIIWIKELYYPLYNYHDLSNRLLSTFWHPNYIVLYLLLLFPIILYNKININKYVQIIFILIFWISIFLTKSIWWNIIFIAIINYYIFNSLLVKIYGDNMKKYYYYIVHIFILIIWLIIMFLYYPEKLQSFLSRFFIWESTLNLIIESPKTFLLWYWFENLDLIFNKEKSIYLYIYENFNFTADRPHNLFLNIWFHLWLIWILIFSFLCTFFVKNSLNNKSENNISIILSILIFLFYTIFNFSSIWSYLVLILIISTISIKNKITWFLKYILLLIISIISFIWIYNSYNKYLSETYFYSNDIEKANDIFKYNLNILLEEKSDFKYSKKIIWFESEKYLKEKIVNLIQIDINCKTLTKNFPIPENFFYCGYIYEILKNEKKSNLYFKNWLNKLPDLRNNNSLYYNNKTIDKETIKHRFLSSKYSNIKEILEKYWNIIWENK